MRSGDFGVAKRLRGIAEFIVMVQPDMAFAIGLAVVDAIHRGDGTAPKLDPDAAFGLEQARLSESAFILKHDLTGSIDAGTWVEAEALMWEVAALMCEDGQLPMPSDPRTQLRYIPDIGSHLATGADETYLRLRYGVRDQLVSQAKKDDKAACNTLQQQVRSRVNFNDPERELPDKVRNLLQRTRETFGDPPPPEGFIAVGLNCGYKFTQTEAMSFAQAGQLIFEINEIQRSLSQSLKSENSVLNWDQIEEATKQIGHQEHCLAELRETSRPAMTAGLKAAAQRDTLEYLQTLGNEALRNLAYGAQGRRPDEICPMDVAVALCHCIPGALTDATSPLAAITRLIKINDENRIQDKGRLPLAHEVAEWIASPGVLHYASGPQSRVKADLLFKTMTTAFPDLPRETLIEGVSIKDAEIAMAAFITINAYENPATGTRSQIDTDLGEAMYRLLANFPHREAVVTIDPRTLNQATTGRDEAGQRL
jgi:hypothetical protein